MNRRIVFGILLVLVLIGAAVSLGVYAYNFGVAQGLAESGKLAALTPEEGARLYPYYGGPFWFHRPFGFGFFGCFGPLFFILLLFLLFRGLWWGGPWGWRHDWKHYGHGERGVPPMFEEWHRQAHSQNTEQTPPPSAGS